MIAPECERAGPMVQGSRMARSGLPSVTARVLRVSCRSHRFPRGHRADDRHPLQPAATPGRVAAIDAYRGFVMLLMMAEVLHLARMAQSVPGRSGVEVPRAASDARRVDRLHPPRPDPAVVLVPGRRRAAVLAGGAVRTRADVRGSVAPRAVAFHPARLPRRLPPLDPTASRRTSPSRTRCRRSAWATSSSS